MSAAKALHRAELTVPKQPGDRDCATEAIGGAHYGPVQVYMSAVSDSASADGSDGWFKVFADTWALNSAGSSGDDDYWGTKDLNTCCGKMDVVIPTDIAAGDYLLRAEALALHTAASTGGAQFYMTCYQLTVTGSGSASPATVDFPGAYAADDPGILVDIHATMTTYIAPGPTVYSGGSTKSAGAACAGCESTCTAGSASTGTASSVASSSTGTGACSVALYGQCGGSGYTGCTTCAVSLHTFGALEPHTNSCHSQAAHAPFSATLIPNALHRRLPERVLNVRYDQGLQLTTQSLDNSSGQESDTELPSGLAQCLDIQMKFWHDICSPSLYEPQCIPVSVSQSAIACVVASSCHARHYASKNSKDNDVLVRATQCDHC